MENYDDYFKDTENPDEKLDILDDPVEFINISERSTLEAHEKENLCSDFLPSVTLQCDKCLERSQNSMDVIPQSVFLKVLHHWLYNFFELLESETANYSGRSACDILFTLVCKFVILSEPQRWMINSREARLALLYDSLYPLSYDLRILACQHTKETISYWPKPDEIRQLSGRVAQLISYGLVGDTKYLVDLIQKHIKGHLETIILLKEEVKQKVLSLIQERPETKDEKRARIREEEEASRGSAELQELLRQKKIQRVSIARSVQMTGLIWNDELEHVIKEFIPLANGIFHTITFHEEKFRLLSQQQQQKDNGYYTIIDFDAEGGGGLEVLFSRYPARLDLLKWKGYRAKFIKEMQSRTKYFSSSTAFIKRMENLCYEMVLPMGCKFHHLRTVDTQYTNEIPSQILELHLGKRTQGWIYNQLAGIGGAYKVAMDPNHIFHACALLSMMTYDLRQNKKMRFYKDYFVQFTQLYSRFETHVINKEIYDAERRPVIFNIKRRVCISHKDMIIMCSPDHNEGLIDATVLWLFFMLYDYNGELENYVNISDWIKEAILS
jgi:hypothetical protein